MPPYLGADSLQQKLQQGESRYSSRRLPLGRVRFQLAAASRERLSDQGGLGEHLPQIGVQG